MFCLMIITSNVREQQILKQAFEQRHTQVILGQASYAHFMKLLQFTPDAILCELPRLCSDQIHFIGLVKKHKRSKSTPIFGYGNPIADTMRNGILKQGVANYYNRPLKFTVLLKTLEQIAKNKNKTIDIPALKTDKEGDIKQILSDETMPEQKIELMVKHVGKILAFPFTVTKVLQLTESEKSGAGDLSKVIEADPGIATNILKVSNTVFFASATRKINSIKDAIVRIGFRETKRIVMGMSVMEIFEKNNDSLGFDRVDFWYHSLAVGIIAERIARRMRDISIEEAFLAGLLHDFGIILLDEFYPSIFTRALERTSEKADIFIEVEEELINIHHNDIVKELFTNWKMPDTIIEGVCGQYEVVSSEENLDTPGKRIALCIAVGDVLAKTIMLGRECDQVIRKLDNWMFQAIKLQTGFTDQVIEEIYNEVKLYKSFLKLEDRDFTEKGNDALESDGKTAGIANLAGDIFVPPALFLAKEGVEIVKMNALENFSQYDQKFDFIVAWGNQEVTPAMLEPLSGILQKNSRALPPGEDPPFAPVLAVLPAECPARGAVGVDSIDYVPPQFELRTLQTKLIELTQGTRQATKAA
ncbi:MAG: HDOD domain-containing protein [Chitinivibrionales bacterium]|nr:HDOD domain-containing protein [Chitinivibrionales bacterium]